MGTITGLVTDRSNAVLPGVTVTAKNTATGAEATTVTSSTGNYVIPNLQVGPYQISFRIPDLRAGRAPAFLCRQARTSAPM